MQQILSKMRSACENYDMLCNGDVVAVGVSGGKDSLMLLYGLSQLQRFYPADFELRAVSIDPCFNGVPSDWSEIGKFCEDLGVPYKVRQTDLYNIIFEDRKEKNPCSLCARMRRGMLHDEAKAMGANKIALGHHMDDAAETFMMNLLYGGRIGSFRPVTYLSRKDITVIRPLIFVTEHEIEVRSEKLSFPVKASSCPVNEKTSREDIKTLIKDLSDDYQALREKITGAMQKDHISGW